MDELVKNLMEELNCDTAFTIPIFAAYRWLNQFL